MNDEATKQAQLDALADHLAARREAILEAWRLVVENDPDLPTADSLSHAQLRDHIPHVLDAFAAALRADTGPEQDAAEDRAEEDGCVHGSQRWQQGYDLREVAREWGHLQLCLLDELESYARHRPDLHPDVMPFARRTLTETCTAGVGESAAKYYSLRQAEAAGQARDLAYALEQLRQLERQRGQAWREAAHDLRNGLSLVRNASTALGIGNMTEEMQAEFIAVLKNGVTSLHAILEDCLSLARLQAGQEQRQIAPFDAAQLLDALCEAARPLAQERGLALHADGTRPLPVAGDAAKVRRIALNLVVNAVKYTEQGEVTISWGDSAPDQPARWSFTVSDTGPGLGAGPTAPLAGALQQVAQEIAGASPAVAAPPVEPSTAHQQPGEGIGLSIVKQLCELLDAALELESRPGQGTTFRVTLPRQYAQ